MDALVKCRSTIIIWFCSRRSSGFGITELGAFATFTNLFGNIVIFLPFGFFMPMASKYRSFWATAVNSLALSLLVETFQLLTKVGCFDVDDLVLNTLGGILGYITFMICNTIRRRYNAKRKGKK